MTTATQNQTAVNNQRTEGADRTVSLRFPRTVDQEQRRRLSQIIPHPIDYMDDPAFHEPDAGKKLFARDKHIPRPQTDWYDRILASPSGRAISPSAATPLLTEEQERLLFLQFNYCRFQAEITRQSILPHRVAAGKARRLLDWYDRATDLRERIAEYNVALVLAMAKRFPAGQLDLPEMVSEGNMALLRAIDKFQISRGFKFSTYACRAILKAFGRLGKKDSRYRSLFPVEFEPDYERSDYAEVRAQEEEDTCAREVKRIFQANSPELSDVEQRVIDLRFNMTRPDDDRNLTLAQVGQMIGLTKERVRQIQNKALAKIRQALEDAYLDPPRPNPTPSPTNPD